MVGQKKFRISKAIIYLLLTLLAFICLYPVLYVLSMSFSNEEHLILRDVYFSRKVLLLILMLCFLKRTRFGELI